MTSKRTRKRCTECPRQCFCSSAKQLQDNHVGGRRHVWWLWIPFCTPDHALYHANCRRAGVDFQKQSNKLMGQIQAFKAQLVGMWMVVEAMEEEVRTKTRRKK